MNRFSGLVMVITGSTTDIDRMAALQFVKGDASFFSIHMRGNPLR